MARGIEERFKNTKFPAAKIKEARDAFRSLAKGALKETISWSGYVAQESKEYKFSDGEEEEAEFYDIYSRQISRASIRFNQYTSLLQIRYMRFRWGSETVIEINLDTLAQIQGVMGIFEEAKGSATEEFPLQHTKALPKIFIGHGRSPLWRDLRDHLRDHHGFEIEAFESGARAGHTIRDIIEEMSDSSDIAFLVLTAEDELEGGRFQARPNVIHEAGLFQGKLGFARAIVLLEEGCEEFSNLNGIQQIRFSRENIRETFGDVLATIRREFSG